MASCASDHAAARVRRDDRRGRAQYIDLLGDRDPGQFGLTAPARRARPGDVLAQKVLSSASINGRDQHLVAEGDTEPLDDRVKFRRPRDLRSRRTIRSFETAYDRAR